MNASASAAALRRRHAAPPVRIVHLGLGNFFRAHQAWYTHRANEGLAAEQQWGIAAFTGRSPAAAERLSAQDGMFTLLVSGTHGPETEVIESVVAAHPGSDLDAWHGYFADPQVAVLTTTITEAGYRRGPGGGLDLADEQVRADLDAWRAGRRRELETAPVRIASGLDARRRAGAGPMAVVPCDNLPGNGDAVKRVVLDAAAGMCEELAGWIDAEVSFVSTAVDRITPRPADADRDAARRLTGVDDPACVVTEPFAEWDIAGGFPAGRPEWEKAGAVFAADVRPYETRKLWLLNGAHSLLAYAGSIRGHRTVADAMGDETVAGWVREWWDAAIPQLSLPAAELEGYTADLVERFRNPSIRHLLAQIASDGTQKMPVRIVPALVAAHDAGRDVDGALRAVAAWVLHARGAGAPLADADEEAARAMVDGTLPEATARTLERWGIAAELCGRALELAGELEAPEDRTNRTTGETA